MTYKLEDVTPRPWNYEKTFYGYSIYNSSNQCVTYYEINNDVEDECTPTENDAQHIVHCVNTHEKLVSDNETLLALVEELVETISSAREKTADLLVGHSACHPSLVPWKLAELDNGIEKATETLNKVKGG